MMIITEKQQAELKEAARPLVEWLQANCDPHCSVTVDCWRAELVSGVSLAVFEVPD
jgi:hypothetical protein